MLRILIVDDSAVVRLGVRQIISEEFCIASFAEAQNADEAAALVQANHWDIMILDISMPGRSGLDVIKEVALIRPRLPILIFSGYPEDQIAVRVLRAGASGYLTKDSCPDELIKAVRKVLDGGKYISAALAEKMLIRDLLGVSGSNGNTVLSDREFEVLRLIAFGKSISEIGQILSLSVKTISTYRRRILQKMRMRTNEELTQYAMRKAIVG